MNELSPPGMLFHYLRAFLGTRLTRLRENDDLGASAVELKKKAIERGMLTLRRSGLIKVAAGVTTLEEVARETIH